MADKLPIIRECITPLGSKFQVWARDSGVGHIDVSITVDSGTIARKDDCDKYEDVLFHPKDIDTAVALVSELSGSVDKDEYLEKWETPDNNIIHPPKKSKLVAVDIGD